jgi:tRNA U34 2-thiouridine synthase MnmA/TrmU
MTIKALGLLSGGLDSHLATHIMQDMGFDITLLNFSSPFCNCTKKKASCNNEAKKIADELGMPCQVEFLGQEYLDIIRNPKFGYGKNMNPCIDCRVMIFKRAKSKMKKLGSAFIFTGEVLDQRPMSQNLTKMTMIERESGLEGYVVRPLSAKLLPPTIPEKEGIIDREKMLSIRGRSRKDQIQLGRDEYSLPEESLCSSGGCLLTDPNFAVRIRDLMENNVGATVKDTHFLKVGRHFRLTNKLKVVVGRNHEENNKLVKMASSTDFLFYPDHIGIKGPLTVIQGFFDKDTIKQIGGISSSYCSGTEGKPVRMVYRTKSGANKWFVMAKPATKEMIEKWRI